MDDRMSYLTPTEGWTLFAVFALFMLGLTWIFTRSHQSRDEHLVANRRVGLLPGAFSIAVSWIWAPAIFVCSLKAYDQGLAGIFWFTLPNIVCFFTFAAIAVRLRRLMPNGYSLPDFVWQRFGGDKRAHSAFLLVAMAYDVTAIIANSLAGGVLMNSLAGISLPVCIIVMALISYSYAIWRGLPASIVTDFIQMSLILFLAVILVPWVVLKAGGLSAIEPGLAGINGSRNIFDSWIMYSFGIPATFGLIAGPVADQMFFQRVMASRMERVVGTFVLGGLVFGIVPIVLSIFGFLAANPAIHSALTIHDPQMVSVDVVQHFLPRWTLFGFTMMALCALASTLDAAYLALGSLTAVDFYRRYIKPTASDHDMVLASKAGMTIFMILGTAIALIPGIQIIYMFLISCVLGTAALVPTVLVIYWKDVTAKGAAWGVITGFIIGLPLSIYASVIDNAHLTVIATILSTLCGGIVTVIGSKVTSA